MKLSELENESEVRLNMLIDSQHFDFDTVIQHKNRRNVFLKPIRKGEKLLNVQRDNIIIDIMYLRPEGKPILWRNIKLECVRYKQEIYYCAKADEEGEEYNRRGDFRLYVGEQFPAMNGTERRAHHVILKDMSSSGFAFISEYELKDVGHALIRIKYIGELKEKVCEIALLGRIVRTMELEDGRILYGCALVKKNDAIGHYIYRKQMEQLADKKGAFSREF